ncbi:MAG: hypothetical protein MUE44_02100 [Oscillatoriaceae cyanobacterium Prado104]|nr:hypothetical protein [Oscillatoriaceae cyanobacterium Prado104]
MTNPISPNIRIATYISIARGSIEPENDRNSEIRTRQRRRVNSQDSSNIR